MQGEAKRLVSQVKHLTGSYYRGKPRQGVDRQLLAQAMRIGRRVYRKRSLFDINDALTQWNPAWRSGFRPSLRVNEPKLDRYRDPRHPGYLLPVATKNFYKGR